MFYADYFYRIKNSRTVFAWVFSYNKEKQIGIYTEKAGESLAVSFPCNMVKYFTFWYNYKYLIILKPTFELPASEGKNMKDLLRRLLSLTLAVVMTVQLLPLQVFAEDTLVIDDPQQIEQLVGGEAATEEEGGEEIPLAPLLPQQPLLPEYVPNAAD